MTPGGPNSRKETQRRVSFLLALGYALLAATTVTRLTAGALDTVLSSGIHIF
jgi:hypothetical protein